MGYSYGRNARGNWALSCDGCGTVGDVRSGRARIRSRAIRYGAHGLQCPIARRRRCARAVSSVRAARGACTRAVLSLRVSRKRSTTRNKRESTRASRLSWPRGVTGRPASPAACAALSSVAVTGRRGTWCPPATITRGSFPDCRTTRKRNRGRNTRARHLYRLTVNRYDDGKAALTRTERLGPVRVS